MAATAPTVEDLVNQALNQIGYTRPIGDIYEGSAASRVALAYYGQTRDELLSSKEWPFAYREVVLAATTGVAALTPWIYEYNYPSDCLRMRQVRPGPLTGGARSNDPQPVKFRVFNEQRTAPPRIAILTDQASAVLAYQGQVTDPATWTPEFIRALVGALAKKLSFGLFKGAEIIKARIALSEQDTMEGSMVDDMAAPMDVPVNEAAGAQR